MVTGHEDPRGERRFWLALLGGVFLAGAIYVGQHWSPSGYAIVMLSLETSETGLVAGVPRAERGDEFAWQTPLLQMTVRNGFQRFDRTPPFFEDLRGLYGMPVRDWALIFKPQFWLFFVAPPAVAYSFYHFLLIALFVVGFTVLFARMGCRRPDALLMALVLFFSAFTQYWWNGSANFFFPFFPWIVLAPQWQWPLPARLLLLFWLLTTALLTYFYPPNAIALGFVALILWRSTWPEMVRWRTLVPLGATAALSAAIVVLYLWQPIVTLSKTVYPGSRIASGGGVPLQMWLTQFLPTSQTDGHASLIGLNICEGATVGSVYALAMLFFLPWRSLLTDSSRPERRQWLWLAAGLLATQAWMMLPLPSWAGYPLLWQRVPPGRMVLAGGVMLMTLVYVLSQARPLRVTLPRAAGLTAALFAGWYLFKRPHDLSLMHSYLDWIYVVPVAAVVALRAFELAAPAAANTTLLASAAALGALSFGTFNPIQSTDPIFRRPVTPLTTRLDAQLESDGRGFVIMPWGSSFFAHSGLPLVGLGYPSLTYSTFDPALDLWRRIFPAVPEDRFQLLFNNAGGIAFGDVPEPQRVPGTLVTLAPISAFLRPGATICDFIRPSRMAFAGYAGCPVRTP